MQLKAAKVYRDPVHDIISYEREGDFGRLIVTLIDTPEFQRLRFVRQVGLASLVFHGAEHSRFAHSMGVAAVARRMFDQIRPDVEATNALRVTTVVGALLHDIGHGPFSHAMERVFGFKHEDYSRALVCDPASEICRVLEVFDRDLPDRVAETITPAPGEDSTRSSRWSTPATRDIVSSQLDADRFDYLLRDSYMTGVEVGWYDLERILLMLEEDADGLIVNVRAFESIEGYLIARYHMYRLVYFHKAVRAAEAMLRMMFLRARELMNAGEELVDATSPLGRLMAGEVLDPRDFSQLSEIEAWAQIRAWSHASDRILSSLARGLVERRLFRSVDQPFADDGQRTRVLAAEKRIRERLTDEEQFAFVIDVASDVPYRPYLPGDPSQGRPIRIRERDGAIVVIGDKSPLVETLGRAGYDLRRWCYHPDLAGTVNEVVADML